MKASAKGAVALTAAVAVLLGAVACGEDSGRLKAASEGAGADLPAKNGRTTQEGGDLISAGEAGGGAEEIKLWFMAGEQYLPVEREVRPEETEPGAAVGPLDATRALLEGPQPGDRPLPQRENVASVSADEAQTLIPAGTEVIDVEVGNRGKAVVELTPRFMDEIPLKEKARTGADRRALSARVGQIVHTVTQFAGVSSAEVRTGGMTIAKSSRPADYAPPPPPRRVETLRPGAEPSGATKRLQKRLVQLRYLPANAADGIYGDQTTQAVLAFQAWQGLDRDGIAGPATHRALSKAKIPKPEADGPRRRVEIHIDEGVVLLVRGGRTVRAIHASGGAPGYETPRGTFQVFRKELMSWSVPYSVWMPYASYFNGGIALHESASVPAFPASHGCVRVPPSESRLVYNFASMGTSVHVL